MNTATLNPSNPSSIPDEEELHEHTLLLKKLIRDLKEDRPDDNFSIDLGISDQSPPKAYITIKSSICDYMVHYEEIEELRMTGIPINFNSEMVRSNGGSWFIEFRTRNACVILQNGGRNYYSPNDYIEILRAIEFSKKS